MKSLGGKDEAEPGSMMARSLRKHLFHITHFLLIRQMQLLSLSITLPNLSTTHGNSPGVCDYVMTQNIIWIVSALKVLLKFLKNSFPGINLYLNSQCSIYSTLAKINKS